MSAPCAFGLESVLSGELKRLEAQDITVSDGKVEFSGDYNMLARANLCLRTAERVQIVLGSFKATTFTELFDNVTALPLEQFVGKKDAFPVKGWSLNSTLFSVPDCQSIIKKAAVKRLSKVYGIDWFEETGAKHQMQFSILRDNVTMMLDTSGPGLHKRGYRQVSNVAPIKETLAAGMLDLARIYPDTQLYDPFCGSGTLLIEGALKAKNIAPGITRRFAAERWGCVPQSAWKQERERAMSLVRTDVTFRGYGSDIDKYAKELTFSNAKKARVSSLIDTVTADVADFKVPSERALVVCNPPYGERLLDLQSVTELYKTMGQVFPQDDNVSYYIISALEDFEEHFGRKADKSRKLYNGMVKCRLFMYLANDIKKGRK